jgi:hypothetical protein
MNFEFEDLADLDHLCMHLLEGERNAATQAHLAAATGLPLRRVQAALEAGKRSGMPIVTGSAGVWLSYDVAELRAFYRANRRRIHTQWLNARGTLKAIAALEGYEQTRLPWTEAA